MIREKYNLIQELQKKNEELKGDKKLSLIGQGDFYGGNNLTRSTMNIKHHSQHLTIDSPEFPYLYDGKENITGEYSSFYNKADKDLEIVAICKKYDTLMKGKSYVALYFVYCKEDDSYSVIERKEVENLTENFGFDYNNSFLDAAEVGEIIPKGTMINSSTSYDANGNVAIGVNGRILYGVHPAVQDDAIIVSKSFAKRMVANDVDIKTISINENTILLNLYGDKDNYQGLPNIGDIVENGILAATRQVRESRMFSDMRDASLTNINQADQKYYCHQKSEVIDINVYCNKPDIATNRVTKQLVQYYNDAKWFYTEVYKACKKILKSGASKIDKEINRWMRKAMNYLDTDALWAFNDTVFSYITVEILLRAKEEIKVGRKIVG